MKAKVIIYVSGGLITEIVSTGEVEVFTQDFDNEDTEPQKDYPRKVDEHAFEKLMKGYDVEHLKIQSK